MAQEFISVTGSGSRGSSPVVPMLPERADALYGLRLFAGMVGGVYLLTEMETRNPRNWVKTALNGASGDGVDPDLTGGNETPTMNYTLVDGDTIDWYTPPSLAFAEPVNNSLLAGSTPGDTCIEGLYKRVSETDSDGGAFYVNGFDFSEIPEGATIHYVRVKELQGKAEDAGIWRVRFQDDQTESPGLQGTEFSLVAALGSLQNNTLGQFGQDNSWSRADLDEIFVRAAFDATAGSFSGGRACYICRLQIEVAWEAA